MKKLLINDLNKKAKFFKGKEFAYFKHGIHFKNVEKLIPNEPSYNCKVDSILDEITFYLYSLNPSASHQKVFHFVNKVNHTYFANPVDDKLLSESTWDAWRNKKNIKSTPNDNKYYLFNDNMGLSALEKFNLIMSHRAEEKNRISASLIALHESNTKSLNHINFDYFREIASELGDVSEAQFNSMLSHVKFKYEFKMPDDFLEETNELSGTENKSH